MVWNRESDSFFHNVGFFSITFFTYYHIVLSIVDSMLTFPSKLLLANSPKDTVDFGRRHEEIREHELKLYQVLECTREYRLIMHCV